MGLGAAVTDKLQETVVENPALEVALKLLAYVTRENPPLGPSLDRGEEGLHVFCHELIENRLLWSAAVVLDRKSAHGAQLAEVGWSKETTCGWSREMSFRTGQTGRPGGSSRH